MPQLLVVLKLVLSETIGLGNLCWLKFGTTVLSQTPLSSAGT